MLVIKYCKTCRKRLLKYGFIASEVYELICEEFLLRNKPLQVCTDIHSDNHAYVEIIRFLELKKFVVSTESGFDFIQVIPLGVHCTLKGDWKQCYICREPHKMNL